ncbi:cell wall-binding repeat-containing protein [Clostridium lundense]|uniref:cell wall-binding repeat-containing protein n=1 Tax=Clostridium lundense TaxID=319475 RepID=UPI00054FFBB3|nr:cell wall-binding repeat-containing protein [Clostridium lundense]
MNNKKLSKIICTAVVSVFLTTTFSSINVMAASVNRVGGQDRFTTARSVAEDIFGKSQNVVLVNGEGYADAVSATPLAKKLGAPILLTKKDSLPNGVLDTIKKIGASNVYIVGGEGVVSTAISDKLKANGLKVTRYAKDGGNRFDTNAVVARELISKTGAKKAILVNGQNGYSDALSVASIAAKLEIPVLITNSVKLDVAVKKVIDDFKLEVMAVGGSGVLNDSIVSSVKGTRVAQGKDRFKTNMAVLNYFKADYSFDKVYVASGGNDSVKNFADALVASAAAAKSGSPVVLSGNMASSQDLSSAGNFIKDNINKNSGITLIGSKGVLSESVENTLNKIAEEASEEDLEIIVIE